MEIEEIAEKLRDLIIGEIREEFRKFKSSGTGKHAGYRLATGSMNAMIAVIEARQAALDSEISNIRKLIDDLRAELMAEIMFNTQRKDDTNKKIDDLMIEVSHIRGRSKKSTFLKRGCE